MNYIKNMISLKYEKSVKKSDDQPLPFLLEFGNIFDIANYKLSFGQPLVGKM